MKRITKIVSMTAVTAALGVIAERQFVAAPHYRGPRSDHFDESHFHNLENAPHAGGSFIKWMMNRERGAWRDWTDASYGPPPPARVDGGRIHVTFINHSTLLLQMDGLNILTDPIWSDRASPLGFAGPKRHRPPGLRMADLPPIDAVLVSHNHYDHLDIPTLRRLQVRSSPSIITPLGNGLLLARHGVGGVRELDWWRETRLSDRVRVTLVPAQHFSARSFSDRDANLWGGFVISGPSGNVYFAGDTGWGPHFELIARKFSPIRLALLPIGAFRPKWFMHPVHISPDEAVQAHKLLGAGTSVAMHFGTFFLGDDGETEPVETLERAIAAAGHPRFWVLGFGEGREVP
jgi:L-ascorbate metabolism protein UlaG (beta-lactamase superfamily)